MASFAGNPYERLLEINAEIGALLGIQVIYDFEPLPPSRWERIKAFFGR
jgi:hypothetical protein